MSCARYVRVSIRYALSGVQTRMQVDFFLDGREIDAGWSS